MRPIFGSSASRAPGVVLFTSYSSSQGLYLGTILARGIPDRS
jgi:hypothetical protein